MDIGFILDNRYEIVDILGSGGMGRVYLGKNIMLGTLWAIKELKNEPGDMNNVLAEVELLKDLDHPALPKVFEVIKYQGSYYVVFTYIKGISLKDKLSDVGSFNENTVVSFGIALCDVLHYLHTREPKPIIYRDLKPSNIMLCPAGDIKLVDFGIAREFKEENTQDTVFIGTRGYAAPEQYGEGQSGQYTDIYSLGITLKQLLTGKSPLDPPYGIGPVSSLNPKVSKKLEQILERCTSRDINHRYQSTCELKNELKTLTEGHENRDNVSNDKKVEIRIENKAYYRQVVISLDNGEFASELAVGAGMTGLSVLLVDIVKHETVCDFYLGISKKYKEFRILKGLEQDEPGAIEAIAEDLDKYIYKLSSDKGVDYVPMEIDSINNENIQNFINIIRMKYDLVVVSTSIKYCANNNRTLLLCADKVVVSGEIRLDSLDYWRRKLTRLCRIYEIENSRIYYIGWMRSKDNGLNIKIAKGFLSGFNFYEGISYKQNRSMNINNYTGPAFVNYGEAKGEYDSILNSLNIAPAGYVRKSYGSRALGFLHKRGS